MQRPNRVFVVDDERVAREGVTLALKKEYQVKAFASAEAVIDALEAGKIDFERVTNFQKLKEELKLLEIRQEQNLKARERAQKNKIANKKNKKKSKKKKRKK